jgi:hypothetical protein
MLSGKPPYGQMPYPLFSGNMCNKSLSYLPNDIVPNASDRMKNFLSCLLQFEVEKRPRSAAEVMKIFKERFQAANVTRL